MSEQEQQEPPVNWTLIVRLGCFLAVLMALGFGAYVWMLFQIELNYLRYDGH